MNPQQGIMSLAKPKQRVSARDSRAVDQVLDNTTQMLGKLDKKTLGLLLQLTQYLKANKPKYKELMANLEGKGALPPGVFPDQYDPKFLSVFALSVAKAQQAKNGMAEGGIASIAQSMRNQGRGKDTMLAHISPEEADLLRELGGVGTTNPATGLPEFGIFDDIGNALSGVGNAVGSVLKPVGDLIGGVLSSPLGMAAAAAAAYYFMGPGAGAVVPSVAGSALPGAVATEAAATALTPAAIEAGIGSAGYGYNASAAASGLFDPSVIGSGAAIGAPSTSEKLLASNLLKNVSSSSDKEEQSDPNALIKMLMMYEMMSSKQNQPTNIPLPELTETTSSLPYDAPKKKMSAFISPQPTQAAGGGLMTKNLGIGGLSAKRSQTDYAKNYLPGSGYRPGQGGVTYFTPMEYTGGDETTTTDTTDTSSSSATDELLRQTLGRTGGGGGMDAESRAAMLAETARRMDEWEASDPEGYRKRNDWIGDLFNGSLIVQLAKLAAQGIDTVKQTWANNRLKALGIDPKIVLANQNELAGMSMEKALQSVGQDTTPSFTERSPEQMAGISMQRALESLGQNTTPRTTLGTPNEIAGSDMQNALNSLVSKPNEIAGYDMQRALNSVYPSTPVAGVQPETDWSKIDAAINQMFSEPSTSSPGPNEITGETVASPEGVARSIGLPAGSITPMKPTNALGDASDVFPGDAANFYGSNADGVTLPGSINKSKREIAALVQQQEYAAKDYMQVGSNLGFNHPITQEYKVEVDRLNDQINDWNNGVLQSEESSKIIQSNPVLSKQEERMQKLLNQTDDDAFKSFFGYEPETAPATPETESQKLDQFVQALLSMEPAQLGEPKQLAALGDFNLGEGETSGDTIGNYNMFTPKEATTPLGVLSTAAIQQAYPGAFDQSPLASLAPTPYSYTGGPSLTSIANSYGNEGSVWTDGSGNPWVGIDGKFLLTGQGAAQNAFNESLAGQEAAMRAEIQSLQNRYPAPSRSDDGSTSGGPSGGRSSDGGDGGGASNSNPGDPGRGGGGANRDGGYGGGGDGAAGRGEPGGDRGGWGRGGGYAHGGIANLHQYNLGSYSDGGRLLKGPGDGVSDSIPATIGQGQPARLADGEFVIPARIVSELGNGSTDAGARKLYAMMDRIQKVRRKTKNVAANTKAAKYLPA